MVSSSSRRLLTVLAAALLLIDMSTAFLSTATFRSAVPATRRPVSRHGVLVMKKRIENPMKGKTKVVLTQNIASVGAADSVVTVRSGFYLNYLLPRGMATLADDAAMQRVADNAAAATEAVEQAKGAAVEIKSKLEGIKTFSVSKKVGENDSIYGSVTPAEVVRAIEEASALSLGSPKITFDDVTTTGTYSLSVSVHPEVTAELE
eukprot:CAMPEP_0118985506 /NCGR_PEP_ID=MMETSP1173-20130426/40124_1 /TAXON_ID=1034831 /ORGANISM="Rhizochromulina marina cf, Strain CCMP1243" /LENGTH=204 /DNA_ID=CAMNT_0006936233 /DNA_START=9 /DNA_END=620 /DNA_ORIENTATION=+